MGGFFGNPDAQLMVRWYQLGAFYPFFRGHAHLETARREPWLFGEETTARIRTAIRSRYAIMPYLYTLFRHANLDGAYTILAQSATAIACNLMCCLNREHIAILYIALFVMTPTSWTSGMKAVPLSSNTLQIGA